MFIQKSRGAKNAALLTATFAAFSGGAARAQTARISAGATPENPVEVQIGARKLAPLSGFGPIYSVNGKELGPDKYAVKIVKRETVATGVKLTCRATAPGLSATYFLTVTQPKNGRIDVALSGDDAVSGVAVGRLRGTDESVKRFYTGEREAEAYAGGEANSHVVYVPSSKLFLRGSWNLDASHAAGANLSLPVKSNFLAKNPPLGYTMAYAGGTLDGKPAPVPKLQERFVLTFSKNL